jgi:hypothetical protein
MTIGYLHPLYAESLSQFGVPHQMPRSAGSILKRPIPEFPYEDAMGCYPLFACKDWSRLGADINDLSGELISLALVTDPFGHYDDELLRDCFRDVVVPFKEHFVVDLTRPIESFVSSHHRRNARNALRVIAVESCEQPSQHADEWVNLYATLVERHHIKGMARFSKAAFLTQLQVPGLFMFRAAHGESTVGMTLWYTNEQNVSYYHLGAYTDLGYELKASFALFWFAMEHFATLGIEWLNLGAGAGVRRKEDDGLARFKRGWSTGTRTAYFCGRILDRVRYDEMTNAKGISETKYFPAYRAGEFQ